MDHSAITLIHLSLTDKIIPPSPTENWQPDRYAQLSRGQDAAPVYAVFKEVVI